MKAHAGAGNRVQISGLRYQAKPASSAIREARRQPMLGFKTFHPVSATIAGIETAQMIRKGRIPGNGTSAFQTFAA